MPNPNNAPDPQNVYILQDFFHGTEVDEALKKADELNETKLEFLQAAEDAVEEEKVESVQQIINTVTVVEKVVEQIPVIEGFKYGTSISLDWEPSTYTLTTQLVDQEGNALGEQTTVKLPYGSIVLGGSYDSEHAQIVLQLSNGTSFDVPVSEFCDGLQAKIDATNKVNADYIDDSTSQHKFVTAAEKAKIGTSINDTGADLEVIVNVADGSRKVTHANANVTPVSTPAFNKVAYDAKGHVTASSPVTKTDVTDLNLNGADIKLTGYQKAVTATEIQATDTVNEAFGKLQKAVEDAGGGGTGSVTRVGLTMPTGFDVSGSPVTTDGTIAVTMHEGYSVPTTEKQSEWDAKLADNVKVNNKLVSGNPVLDGSDIVLTGYVIADQPADVADTDTVNQAIGKLQKTIKEGGGGSGAVSSVSEMSNSHLSVSPTTGNVKVGVESGYTIPADEDITAWNAKQNALTEAQLSAVNSGITASKLETLEATSTAVQTRVISQLPQDANLLYASSIDVTIDNSTYVVTFQLKDQKGDNIGSAKTIDLPIESLVMSVTYDSVNKAIKITLKDGTVTTIPVTDITSGLQPTIDADHQVSSDFINDTDKAHKFVSADEKTRIANSVNAVKTVDAENVSGLAIETDGTDKVITHTNNVTAETTGAFNKVLYDAHGHITGATPVIASDVTGLVSGKNLTLTDYEIAGSTSAITASDTVNQAIGKLEKGVATGTKIYTNTTAGWDAQPDLVSVADAVYVYSDYDVVEGETIPAIKMGDGITKVKTLKFVSANGVTSSKIAEWNDKVSARLVGEILELF